MSKQFKQNVSQILTSLLGDTPSHMITPHTRRNSAHFSRLLLLGLMASFFSILGGIVPDFAAQQPSQIFSSAARASEFSDRDLRNYAAVLVEIEPIRKSTLAQVSRAMGRNKLPNLVCNQPETMAGLNGDAKSLFIDYCNQYFRIVSKHQLSLDRFNEITQSLRADPKLKERVNSFIR